MIGLGHALTLALSPMAGGAAFDPMNIAALSEWFDYRTLAGVEDYHPVSSWSGRKGLYTLIQEQSPDFLPIKGPDPVDGMESISFDGDNDRLYCDVNNGTLFGATGDYEFWMNARLDAMQSFSGGYFSISGQSNQIGFNAALSGVNTLSMSYGTVSVYPEHLLCDGVFHVIRCSKSGARRIVQVDGVTIYDEITSAGPHGAGGDILEMGNCFGYYMTGSFRHWLAFKEPLDDATAAALTSYLLTA